MPLRGLSARSKNRALAKGHVHFIKYSAFTNTVQPRVLKTKLQRETNEALEGQGS